MSTESKTYRCPSCNGIVTRDDEKCPHCEAKLYEKTELNCCGYKGNLWIFLAFSCLIVIATALNFIGYAPLKELYGKTFFLIFISGVFEIIGVLSALIIMFYQMKMREKTTMPIVAYFICEFIVQVLVAIHSFISESSTTGVLATIMAVLTVVEFFIFTMMEDDSIVKAIAFLVYVLICLGYKTYNFSILITAKELISYLPNEVQCLIISPAIEMAGYICLVIFIFISFKTGSVSYSKFLGISEINPLGPKNEKNMKANAIVQNIQPKAKDEEFDNSIHKLKEMKALLDSGIITQAEFDEFKNRTLKNMK